MVNGNSRKGDAPATVGANPIGATGRGETGRATARTEKSTNRPLNQSIYRRIDKSINAASQAGLPRNPRCRRVA